MRRICFVLTLAVMGLSAAVSLAQGPGGEGGRGPGGPGRGGPGGPGGGFGRGFGRMPNPIMEAIDADKNGELSAEEIAGAAVALKKLDKDNDGKLSAEELRPAMPTPEQMAEQMVARFMENDANKDGKLVVDEVPEQIAQFIGRADADGNGEITKEELMKFAKENAGRFGGGRGGPPGGGRPGGAPGEGGARPERPASPE